MYLCRLCLKKSTFRYSLFIGNLLERIESLTSIKITKDDNFPKTCCESCLANVYSAYEFQQCVISAHKTLQKLCKSDIEDHTEVFKHVGECDITKNVEKVDDNNADGPTSNFMSDDSSTSATDITDVVMLDDQDICGTFTGGEIITTEGNIKNESIIIKEEYCDIKEELADDFNLVAESEDFELQNDEKTSFECVNCDAKFATKRLLQLHMSKHRLENCPVCFSDIRRDNFKKHLQIHFECPEICEICGKIAKNKESLRGHINYEHKKKAKIKCQHCNKEFKSSHHYKTHVRNVHLGIRNHQCHICGKKFFANHDLQKHINMTHKKARPFVCPYCEKGFCSPYARKTHIRQHTLETPYECKICACGFRQKVSLVKHMRSKHPDDIIESKD